MIFTRRHGQRPPPTLILAFMVMPFAFIDTFAVLALGLGLADIVVHLIMAWIKTHPKP